MLIISDYIPISFFSTKINELKGPTSKGTFQICFINIAFQVIHPTVPTCVFEELLAIRHTLAIKLMTHI
jgi:hypothetical protein